MDPVKRRVIIRLLLPLVLGVLVIKFKLLQYILPAPKMADPIEKGIAIPVPTIQLLGIWIQNDSLGTTLYRITFDQQPGWVLECTSAARRNPSSFTRALVRDRDKEWREILVDTASKDGDYYRVEEPDGKQLFIYNKKGLKATCQNYQKVSENMERLEKILKDKK